MVAYSFKRMFVPAIRLGLGLDPIDHSPGARRPKLQTIRADGRRRHARPGDELQLYTAMRTKQCELIGKARCTDALPIIIRFPKPYRPHSLIRLPSHGIVLAADLDKFAMSDGFADWQTFREFWAVNHPGVLDFDGVLIRWEPLG